MDRSVYGKFFRKAYELSCELAGRQSESFFTFFPSWVDGT